MNHSTSSKAVIFLIFFLVVIVLSLIGLMVFVSLGSVSGTEFSPDDFSRRRFSYTRVPGLNWVITKKRYDDFTGSLEQALVADNLISVPSNPRTKNWHLVNDNGFVDDLVSAECDARFLTKYLDLQEDEGDNFWIPWNDKFPRSAKVFWPLVAQLARDEMYLRIPDVMRLGIELESDDLNSFEPKLKNLAAEIYADLGSIDFEQERFQRAKTRLQRSLDLRPAEEISNLLDECNQAIADSTLSSDDAQKDLE